MSRFAKYKKLDSVAPLLGCQGLETGQFKRLFSEIIPWKKVAAQFKE